MTSHQCPPPVLNHTLVESIQGNNSEACVSAGSWVLCQILAVNKDISQIDDVMTSGFCVGDSPGDVEGEGSCSEESSSIRCFNCHECKKWYKDWMCMSMWPLWLGGHRILPCSSICSLVQEHCPFNIIMEDASTAGGDPTFICEDPIVINSSFVNPVQQSSSSGTESDPSNQQQNPASLHSSPPQCCAQPVQLFVGSSAGGGGADGTADPPAGGYVDLNATVCLPLLREWTSGETTGGGGGSTAYCDSGYSTAASGGLRLLNTSLILRQIEAPTIQSNWFWNIVTLNSGGVTQWTASSRPAILTLLLAVIYFYRCQYCIEQRKDYSSRLPS